MIGRFVAISLLGAATGLRSLAAPSQLSGHVRRRKAAASAGIEWLGNPWLHRLLQAAAVGEMVADKLPTTPNRIAPGPLAGRVLLGAGCGAGAARLNGGSATRGALLGGVGAVVGAYAGYHTRRLLVHSARLPDPAVALCEDVLAVGLARTALRRRRSARPGR